LESAEAKLEATKAQLEAVNQFPWKVCMPPLSMVALSLSTSADGLTPIRLTMLPHLAKERHGDRIEWQQIKYSYNLIGNFSTEVNLWLSKQVVDDFVAGTVSATELSTAAVFFCKVVQYLYDLKEALKEAAGIDHIGPLIAQLAKFLLSSISKQHAEYKQLLEAFSEKHLGELQVYPNVLMAWHGGTESNDEDGIQGDSDDSHGDECTESNAEDGYQGDSDDSDGDECTESNAEDSIQGDSDDGDVEESLP
jgi:hypothetical protein